MFQEYEIVIKVLTFMLFIYYSFAFFQRTHPTLETAVDSRFAFVCRAPDDFALLGWFDLTHFIGSQLCSSVASDTRRFIQVGRNNVFISTLETPDNALIEADKPLTDSVFFHG